MPTHDAAFPPPISGPGGRRKDGEEREDLRDCLAAAARASPNSSAHSRCAAVTAMARLAAAGLYETEIVAICDGQPRGWV